jgi:hypothetical protein
MRTSSISYLLKFREQLKPTEYTTFNTKSCQVSFELPIVYLNTALALRVVGSAPDYWNRRVAVLYQVVKIPLKFGPVITINGR